MYNVDFVKVLVWCLSGGTEENYSKCQSSPPPIRDANRDLMNVDYSSQHESASQVSGEWQGAGGGNGQQTVEPAHQVESPVWFVKIMRLCAA